MTSFTGTIAIRGMGVNLAGDVFQAVIYPGTQAGLQSAIDAGGKVSIGPGTLLLTSALTMRSNVTVEGSGMGQTILKHSGTTLHTMISASSNSDFIISDLTIDGDQTGVSTYNADRWLREETIDLATCTDVVIKDVEITACRGQGIYGTSCTRVTVEGCYIHDTDNWGSVFKVANDVDYFFNHVENAFTHGLYVDSQTNAAGSNRIRFIGNTVISVANDAAHADSGVGISVHNAGSTSGTYDVIIADNYCRTNGAIGFSLTPSKRTEGHVGKMIVSGNISEGHTTNVGIGYELIATNVTATGNIAKNNVYHFTTQNSQGINLVGNHTISAIGSSQIAFILSPAGVSDHVEDFTMVGNSVRGGTGFQVSSTATTTPHTNIQVRGNQFVYCENAVIMQANCLTVAVCENQVNANNGSVTLGRGLLVYGDDVQICNNHIWAKTGTDCIVISSGQTTDELLISGNMMFSGRYGLNFGGSVTTAVVCGNYMATMATNQFNGKNNVTNWRDGGDNSWNFVTAAPATEYWHVGTKVYDTAVAPSSFIGWVCTTAGTPGTWKTWGATSA